MAELRTAHAEPRVMPRRLHALRIELGPDGKDGEGGGHVVHHEYRGGGPAYMGSGEEEGPHIFGSEDGEKLLDHIKKHAKIKIKDDEELEDEHDTPRESEKKHHKREKAKDEESHEDEGETAGEKAEEEEEHEED